MRRAPPPPPSEPELPKIDLNNPRAVCEATVEQLRLELHRLTLDHGASPRDRATVSTALTSATRLHARLCGALDISKSQIVRSPHWAEIVAAMGDALAAYPEAAAAVAAAIQRLEGL